MKTSIYIDHAASTRLHPKALEAMLPHLEGHFGNPSGTYALGRQAARTIDNARSTVASLLGARPREILFTGPEVGVTRQQLGQTLMEPARNLTPVRGDELIQ